MNDAIKLTAPQTKALKNGALSKFGTVWPSNRLVRSKVIPVLLRHGFIVYEAGSLPKITESGRAYLEATK